MTNSRTRLAFKSIAKTIQDISVLIVEENKGMSGSAVREFIVCFFVVYGNMVEHIAIAILLQGDAFSTRYETKLETLRDKLRRAKGGLKDSILFGTWMLVENAGELF